MKRSDLEIKKGKRHITSYKRRPCTGTNDSRFGRHIAKLGKETRPHIHATGRKEKGLHMEMEKNNSD